MRNKLYINDGAKWIWNTPDPFSAVSINSILVLSLLFLQQLTRICALGRFRGYCEATWVKRENRWSCIYLNSRPCSASLRNSPKRKKTPPRYITTGACLYTRWTNGRRVYWAKERIAKVLLRWTLSKRNRRVIFQPGQNVLYWAEFIWCRMGLFFYR